ncbi:hypothetical protein CYMTET_35459, partial [Cymbomonas tetramitiformis]
MRGETVLGASSDDLQGKPADVGDKASIQRASNLVDVVTSGQVGEEPCGICGEEGEDVVLDPSEEERKVSTILPEGPEGKFKHVTLTEEVATREGNVVGKLDDGEGDEEGGGFLQEEAVFRGDTEAGEETGLLHARKVGNVRDEGGVGRGEVRGTIKLSKESGREGGGAGARKGEGEVREGDKGFCPLAAGDDGEVKRGVELPVDGQRGKGRAGGSNGRREEFGESERVNGRGE